MDVDKNDMRLKSPSMRDGLFIIGQMLALTVGGFGLLNLMIEPWAGSFDGNLLWIDLRWLPRVISVTLLALGCGMLVAFAARPVMSAQRRRLTLVVVAILIVIACANAIQCMVLHLQGTVELAILMPFSVLVVCALGWIGVAAWLSAGNSLPEEPESGFYSAGQRRRRLLPNVVLRLGVIGLLVVGFPLAQMIWFGTSDYRRSADAVVVLGARAYADGTLSDALEDRVRTACELYESGRVKKLIFSGGPGDGAIYEAQAMKMFAQNRGIPADAILLDLEGVNTRATVENTKAMFKANNIKRVLVVSHDYHLSRIKLAYQQHGIEAFTVPAKQQYRLKALPFNVAREVAAWWWYYLYPLRG